MAIIGLQHVKSAFSLKVPKVGLKKSDIAQRIIENNPALQGADQKEITKEVGVILDRNKALFTHKDRSLFYKMKKQKPAPLPSCYTGAKVETSFMGSYGELVVASELSLLGYNTSRMTVDDGVDIVASKGSNLYYVQVKSTTLGERLDAKLSIGQKAYTKNLENYIRYILVIRCGKSENRFFKFDQATIDLLLRERVISKTTDKYNFYIVFQKEDGRPYLSYRDKMFDISDYQNKFDL